MECLPLKQRTLMKHALDKGNIVGSQSRYGTICRGTEVFAKIKMEAATTAQATQSQHLPQGSLTRSRRPNQENGMGSFAHPFTHTFRVRGPSNSQKYTACHCPNMSRPSSTRICRDDPIIEAFTCAAEFPSAWA